MFSQPEWLIWESFLTISFLAAILLLHTNPLNSLLEIPIDFWWELDWNS